MHNYSDLVSLYTVGDSFVCVTLNFNDHDRKVSGFTFDKLTKVMTVLKLQS